MLVVSYTLAPPCMVVLFSSSIWLSTKFFSETIGVGGELWRFFDDELLILYEVLKLFVVNIIITVFPYKALETNEFYRRFDMEFT